MICTTPCDPTFFERVNPLWPPYVAKDTARTAQRLKIPFRWPQPDPIVQDMQTRKVAPEQPHIRRLTRLAQLAQLASGHWGASLMVVGDEIFFGQDRPDDLFWHLQQLGLRERG